MNSVKFFSSSYLAAQQRFVSASKKSGFTTQQFLNPSLGPSGEKLAIDVLRIGPEDARKIFLSISGTHGVEGFCGSGIQVGTLLTEQWHDLPPDTAMVMIHAINPFGFAWLRRVNEDNVDLNRNHVKQGAAYPDNPGYECLREAICPLLWDECTKAATAKAFHAYSDRHGTMALQQAVTGGQYSDPKGVFYGGARITWSAEMLYNIVRQHTAGARHLVCVDYHSGLGPYGYGELISEHPEGHPSASRLAAWLGEEVTFPDNGSSTSTPVVGTNAVGIANCLTPGTDFTMLTLEYGTFPIDQVLDSVRADCWLHAHGQLDSSKGQIIKAAIRRCFYPDQDDWKMAVWNRAVEVQARILHGLRDCESER